MVTAPPAPAAPTKRTHSYVLDSDQPDRQLHRESAEGGALLKRPRTPTATSTKSGACGSPANCWPFKEDLKAFAQIQRLCKSTTAKGKAARQAQAQARAAAGARARRRRRRSSWCRRSPAPPRGPGATLALPDGGQWARARSPAGPCRRRARVRRRFVLVFDAATAGGTRHATPAEGKGGSLCGGASRAVLAAPGRARQAAPDEEDCYYCVESKAMVMRCTPERMADGTLQPANEQELLELMRTGTTAVERSAGSYDEQIILTFARVRAQRGHGHPRARPAHQPGDHFERR